MAKQTLYWNFVRVRVWVIKEPTWQCSDINQDGIVDVKDLHILSKNYGKTLSLRHSSHSKHAKRALSRLVCTPLPRF
ncbi:MAG TPA: hypothetical protein VJ249_08105 [Candidatus Bathyarchaeia archaeon]|nr:hypothetical protein [Candidatus Bathyarchaeia archaeon]